MVESLVRHCLADTIRNGGGFLSGFRERQAVYGARTSRDAGSFMPYLRIA
jgi:hypothetical protein